MSDDITHDLDLLDDWLAGKGYGEEAGLVLRALSLIHKLQDGVRSTIQERDVLSGENFDLRAENEKLRAAIFEKETVMQIRAAAAAALKEMGMSDIVEELRSRSTGIVLLSDPPQFQKDGLCQQAANEIERLRAENEKLRAALKPLADEVEYVPSRMDDDDWYEMDTIKVGHLRAAAAALKETGDE